MPDVDLCYTPATELTRLIAARSLSPVELMRATVARAEALNPSLNAICTDTFESAMQAARAAEAAVMRGDALAPLHGIPTSIKDLSFTRGVRTMAGSHLFRDRVPTFDAPFVTKLRESGAISIGKTTCPELGWKGNSHSPLTGYTHNPWKHGMNAGGSSSGAAVLAAAGIGPIHQGSDGAGSIRMPAAFCGVYGLKPTFGVVPYFPTPNNGFISHVGPLTRSVGDAALMLSVMSGFDDNDILSPPMAPRDYTANLEAGIAGLRVAYSPDLGRLRVDPEVASVVHDAVRVFETLGCVVEQIKPDWDDPLEMEYCLFSSAFAGMLGHLLEEWEDRLDPGAVALARHGLTYSAADYMRACAQRLELYSRMSKLMQRYDLLLTPSLSVAAFPVEYLIPPHWEQHPWDWLRWAGFSYPFNLTLMPAATCPAGFTPAGLPVGLQIVAGRFKDELVLQASRAFEQARPWADKRPRLDT